MEASGVAPVGVRHNPQPNADPPPRTPAPAPTPTPTSPTLPHPGFAVPTHASTPITARSAHRRFAPPARTTAPSARRTPAPTKGNHSFAPPARAPRAATPASTTGTASRGVHRGFAPPARVPTATPTPAPTAPTPAPTPSPAPDSFAPPAPKPAQAPTGGTGAQWKQFMICKVPVRFPFQPYRSQMAMMSAILRSLTQEKNALLESPTGSGKSLALLCSALAWQAEEQARLDRQYFEDVRTYDQWFAQQNRMVMAAYERPRGGAAAAEAAAALAGSGSGVAVVPSDAANKQPGSAAMDATADGVKEERPGKRKRETVPIEIDDSSALGADVGGSGRKTSQAIRRSLLGTDDDSDSDSEFQSAKTSSRPSGSAQTAESSRGRDPGNAGASATTTTAAAAGKGKEKKERVMSIPVARTPKPPKPKRKLAPKIFFGSRTHKQISQIISELKTTAYTQLKVSVLSSRDHTCIHPRVSKSRDRNEGCAKLLEQMSTRKSGCTHYLKIKSLVNHADVQRNGSMSVWDIEDFVDLGRRTGGCPFFGAREMVPTAQIVLCPYNYIIDPIIRDQMSLNVKGNVIILDEAHNIEDSSREAASFSYTSSVIFDVVEDLAMLQSVGFRPDLVAQLHVCLNQLSQWLEGPGSAGLQKTSFECSTKMWQGARMQKALAASGLTATTVPVLLGELDKLKEALSDTGAGKKDKKDKKAIKPPKMRGNTIPNAQRILTVLGFFFRDNCQHLMDYSMVVEEKAIASRKGRGKQHRKVMTLTLHVWCLNPEVAFTTLQEARSIILTSGTLSPLNSFATELGTPFDFRLEANHVVDREQVWAQTMGTGPSGKKIVATYEHTDTFQFKDDVGALVLNTCMVVPYGVLLFVSSYRLLDLLCKRWQQTKVWQKISERKVIVCEPRGGDKEEFQSRMDRFYGVIKSVEQGGYHGITGALFIAVCRGKVSEGLDFADNNARAVISIGIPYPSSKDAQVDLKKRYNEQQRSAGRPLLSGSEWYVTQAFRAINQGLGRCLRHRNDWGALLIVDARFGQQKNTRGLSRWIQNFLVPAAEFHETMASLKNFVEHHVEQARQQALAKAAEAPPPAVKAPAPAPAPEAQVASMAAPVVGIDAAPTSPDKATAAPAPPASPQAAAGTALELWAQPEAAKPDGPRDLNTADEVEPAPPAPAPAPAPAAQAERRMPLIPPDLPESELDSDGFLRSSPPEDNTGAVLSQSIADAMMVEDVDSWSQPSTQGSPATPESVLRCAGCTRAVLQTEPVNCDLLQVTDPVLARVGGLSDTSAPINLVRTPALAPLPPTLACEPHACVFADGLGCCLSVLTCGRCGGDGGRCIVGVRVLCTTTGSAFRDCENQVWFFTTALWNQAQDEPP